VIKVYVKIFFKITIVKFLLISSFFSCILVDSLLAAGTCTVIAACRAASTFTLLAVAIRTGLATATLTGINQYRLITLVLYLNANVLNKPLILFSFPDVLRVDRNLKQKHFLNPMSEFLN